MIVSRAMTDQDIVRALLSEASQLSAPFQNLIHDYALDVMNDPEAHRLFTERLRADLPIQNQIKILKESLSSPGPLSPLLRDVLASAFALPADRHATLRNIVDLVAIELVYKRRDLAAADSPPAGPS
jgi:hypothetical protein